MRKENQLGGGQNKHSNGKRRIKENQDSKGNFVA
jgi:hypothetical protein